MLPSDSSTAPSSPPPADAAVFSDEPVRPSSPPSSPPGFPWEQQQTSSHNTSTSPSRPSKSAFSVLGKRRALDLVSDNVRPAKKTATASSKPETKALTQMQISLGQEVQKKCKQCGMGYVPSSDEDRKLHDKYHKQNTEGYDVGRDFVQKARDHTIFEGAKSGDAICAIDFFDKPARKRRAHAVLEIVQRELGAVPIPEKQIWDFRENQRMIEPKFRAYLYVRGTKCVGFLLTEKSVEAHRVLKPDGQKVEDIGARGGTALAILKARKEAAEEAARQAATQPIHLSKETHTARLGISRIWTSPSHRKQDIAGSLLNAAVLHDNECAKRDEKSEAENLDSDSYTKLPESTRTPLNKHPKPLEKLRGKEEVAFSQPTEAGARLARRWFGKLYGWMVYVD